MLLIEKQQSKDGLATKYIWTLSNGKIVESAYFKFPTRDYDGVCVSSQVGCNLGCTFCATGLEGLVKNLECEDIISQVERIIQDINYPERKIEVSFTGMGEPLLNFQPVLGALEYLEEKYSNIQFTLSTVGIVPEMYKLAQQKLKLQLRISLHAPNDDLRTTLMPITKKYSIHDVLNAAVHFAETTNQPVIINYLLLSGVNDANSYASELVKLLKGLPVRLRISRLSPVSETIFQSATNNKHKEFEKICVQGGIDTYQFENLGLDIEVGMGQMRPHYRNQGSIQPLENTSKLLTMVQS